MTIAIKYHSDNYAFTLMSDKVIGHQCEEASINNSRSLSAHRELFVRDPVPYHCDLNHIVVDPDDVVLSAIVVFIGVGWMLPIHFN